MITIPNVFAPILPMDDSVLTAWSDKDGWFAYRIQGDKESVERYFKREQIETEQVMAIWQRLNELEPGVWERPWRLWK